MRLQRSRSWGLVLALCLASGCGGGSGGGNTGSPPQSPSPSPSPSPLPPLPETHAVGGTVTGLNGTLVLTNNGGDNLSVLANGSFRFATPVASGNAYQAGIQSQPANQRCTVS